MTSHVCREYDIRGGAERDLPDDLLSRIGLGLARLLRPDGQDRAPRIAVGRDCRLSGPRLFAALTSGLRQGGVEVLDVGVGPTPKLYFSVHHLDVDGGVMITGSHNPAEDNGFKIMRGKHSFFGAAIQELCRLVEQGDFSGEAQGSLREVDIDEAYVTRLAEDIELPSRKLKFVVDGGNGAAGPLGVRAMQKLGLEPVQLFCEMDGRFPN